MIPQGMAAKTCAWPGASSELVWDLALTNDLRTLPLRGLDTHLVGAHGLDLARMRS